MTDTELVNADVLTRSAAMLAGHKALERAKAAYNESQDKAAISRLGTTGNRLEEAIYWNTRASAFYAMAALLPE